MKNNEKISQEDITMIGNDVDANNLID